MTKCQVLGAKFAKSLFQSVFDALDDGLFDLTGKIQNDEERNLFFEGLRTVRLEKERFGKTFHSRFAHYFNTAATPASPGAAASKSGAAGGELALVQDSQLEEELAVDNLIAKLRERHSEELYGLVQRFKQLLPQAPIDDDQLPLGPENFCRAFRDAVGILDVDIKIKLYAYKLLDRILTTEIGALYTEINKYLGERGVLPQLKSRIRKRPASAAPAPRATGAAPGNGPAAAGAGPMPIQEQMFQAMQHLLNVHFSGGGEAGLEEGGGGGSGIYLPVTPMLLDTLSALQQDDEVTEAGARLVRGRLKQHVVGRFTGQDTAGRPKAINQIDDETIDVISMIFDYILDDRTLPDFIKALIGRLQIPVLKVAIIDREFFSRKSHPARQLLNALAQAGMGWSEESEAAKDRLYEKMESVVMRILHDFEDDVGIFERLLAEFTAFLEEEKKVFDVAQEKISEAAQEAEQVERVKKGVAEEIASRLIDCAIPEEIRDFLVNPWRRVITDLTLAEGADGAQCARARALIDDLIWSISPKVNGGERKRLVALLPLLLETLRDGLRRIDYSAEDIEGFIQTLGQYHFTAMKGAGRAPSPAGTADSGGPAAPVDELDALLQELKCGEELTDVDLDNISGLDDLLERKQASNEAFERMMAEMGFERDKDEGPRIEDEHTERVRALELGTWVELADAAGGTVRAKLAWKGDEFTNFSFVNRQYKVVAERPLYVLAEEFRRGTARIIEDLALFDRAMDGVISGIVKLAS